MRQAIFNCLALLASCAFGIVRADATTISFSGSSPTSGALGNTRTFSQDGIAITASADSLIWNTPTWEPAYLGLYADGLGVTNRLETNGMSTYMTDNMGSADRVIFSFSMPVVLETIGLSACGYTNIGVYYFSDGSWNLLENNFGGADSRIAGVNEGNISSSVWAVGALCPASATMDSFDINSVSFSPSSSSVAVPDSGGSLTLLAIGVGILGTCLMGAGRRRAALCPMPQSVES